jgi:hypothetical protein
LAVRQALLTSGQTRAGRVRPAVVVIAIGEPVTVVIHVVTAGYPRQFIRVRVPAIIGAATNIFRTITGTIAAVWSQTTIDLAVVTVLSALANPVAAARGHCRNNSAGEAAPGTK